MQLRKKLVYATCLLALLTGCNQKADKSDTGNAPGAIRVTVASAKERNYTPDMSFTGSAEANREANLGASIPGRVEKIHFSKGSYVPEGAVIVEMSDELLIQAEIEMEALRKDLERMTRLKEKESVSVMDYDHVKAKFDAAQSKVEMLKKNTSIIAPFGGVLTDISVNEGENYTFIPSVGDDMTVRGGIVTIRQLNPLKINVEVNEKEIASIVRGQEVSVEFDAYPNEPVQGKVSYISPVLSARTRTSTVEITIPNRNLKFKPGMYCKAHIFLPATDGVFIPANAVYRQQGTGDNFVYVVKADEKSVERRVAHPGIVVGTEVLVPELKNGERVVLEGKNKLSDGAAIEIVTD